MLTDIHVAAVGEHRYQRDFVEALNVEQHWQAMRAGAMVAAGGTPAGSAVALGASGTALARSRSKLARTLFPANPRQIMSDPNKDAMLRAPSNRGFNLRAKV
jgi:hypothetical protein